MRFLGDIALELGAYAKARRLYKESLSIHITIEERETIAQNLENLGHIAHALGEYEIARGYYEESLMLAEEISDPRRVAFALIGLGNIAHALGEFEEALGYYQGSLAISEEIGQPWQKARSLRGLGRVTYQQGKYAQARQYQEENLALCRTVGLQLDIARTLKDLGMVAIGMGNPQRARQYFHEALIIGTEVQARPVVLECFVEIAELLATEGELERAIGLLSLSLHHPTSHADTKVRAERLLRELETQLPPDRFEIAQARGKDGTPETIAALLLAELAGAKKVPVSSQLLVELLSVRELEVLHLIADGLSNLEIADQLHIGVSTVKKHITHIYDKLDVNSRTQAVNHARELSSCKFTPQFHLRMATLHPPD